MLLNDGTGQLTPAGQWQVGTVLDITAGDVDGDGHRDLVSVLTDVGLQVQLGLGGGAFASGFTVHLGPPHTYSDAQGVRVFPGLGTGAFATAVVTPLPYAVQRLEVGDVDADGFLDLVVLRLNSAPGMFTILAGDGSGAFSPRQDLDAEVTPYFMALGDLGNGQLRDGGEQRRGGRHALRPPLARCPAPRRD